MLSNNSNDPEVVTKALADHFLVKGLTNETDLMAAVDAFKAEVPQNYFDEGSWNLDWDIAPAQVVLLMLELIKQPDVQLL
jgi:hypothetical protein